MFKILKFFFLLIFILYPFFLYAEGLNSKSNKNLKREEKKAILSGGIDSSKTKIDSKNPIYIGSDSLSFDANKRFFSYIGNVEAFQGDLLITSDILTGNYNKENQLTKVIFRGNVVITRADKLRAISNKAIYYVPEKKILLTEGPELLETNNALSADKIVLFLEEQRSEAQGRVRVKLVNTSENENIMDIGKDKK